MKPHRTDGVSLSFGLIFLIVVAWWLIAQVVDVELPALGWFAAGALILFGGFGLLGALRSSRASAAAGPADETAIEPVSGIPPELHAEIVQELTGGPSVTTGTAAPRYRPVPPAGHG